MRTHQDKEGEPLEHADTIVGYVRQRVQHPLPCCLQRTRLAVITEQRQRDTDQHAQDAAIQSRPQW